MVICPIYNGNRNENVIKKKNNKCGLRFDWVDHKHQFTLRASLSGTFLQLCQIWLRHWRGTLYLRAAVHRRDQRPQKVSGTNMTVEATHIPSTAFWHLPPNSARFTYATEGALFISAQLFSDAVSALRKVPVLIWL